MTFKTGQVLSLQVSWAEMVKREEVSVVFQGTGAGGKVERLFGTDGLDTETHAREFAAEIDFRRIKRIAYVRREEISETRHQRFVNDNV